MSWDVFNSTRREVAGIMKKTINSTNEERQVSLTKAKNLVWNSKMDMMKKHGLIAEIDYYNCRYSEGTRIWWLLDEDGSYADFIVEETVPSSTGENQTAAYPVDCTTNIRTKINRARFAENGLVYVGRVHGINWETNPCEFEEASAINLLNQSTRLIACEDSISKVSEVLNFGGLEFQSLNDLNYRIRVLDEILDELHSIQNDLTIQYFRTVCSRYIERADRIRNLFTNPSAILNSIRSIFLEDFDVDVESGNPQEAILNAYDFASLLRAIQLLADLQQISESLSSSDDEDDAVLVDGMIESLRCLDIAGAVSHKLISGEIDSLHSWSDLEYSLVYELLNLHGFDIIRTATVERVAFIADADHDASAGRETGWRQRWFSVYECVIVNGFHGIIHQTDWVEVADFYKSYNTLIDEAESAWLYDLEKEAEFSAETRKWLSQRAERIRALGPYPEFLSGSHAVNARVVGYSYITTEIFHDGLEDKYSDFYFIDLEGELDTSSIVDY